VERICEYSGLQEIEKDTSNSPSNSNWPSVGNIEFVDYSTRYREGLDLVLEQLSFEVNQVIKLELLVERELVKSSLTLAFVLNHRTRFGTIKIDGVDITKLDLQNSQIKFNCDSARPCFIHGAVKAESRSV